MSLELQLLLLARVNCPKGRLVDGASDCSAPWPTEACAPSAPLA